jgi:bacterioferritin (cytochrome b1)
MLKKQKAFEDETVKRLTPLYNAVKNPLVRLFIHKIILDTMEHSDLYKTLIELNKHAVVGDIDRKIMTEELTNHVKEENKMLNEAIEISMSIQDENTKKILESIVEDERRHHQILQELLKIIEKEGEDWNRYLYEMFTGAGIP